jgi:hypothetical protein
MKNSFEIFIDTRFYNIIQSAVFQFYGDLSIWIQENNFLIFFIFEWRSLKQSGNIIYSTLLITEIFIAAVVLLCVFH